MLHSYKNQLIGLQWKSIVWFLYQSIIDLIWVNWTYDQFNIKDSIKRPVLIWTKGKEKSLKSILEWNFTKNFVIFVKKRLARHFLLFLFSFFLISPQLRLNVQSKQAPTQKTFVLK